jgi:hypothetical protein
MVVPELDGLFTGVGSDRQTQRAGAAASGS